MQNIHIYFMNQKVKSSKLIYLQPNFSTQPPFSARP